MRPFPLTLVWGGRGRDCTRDLQLYSVNFFHFQESLQETTIRMPSDQQSMHRDARFDLKLTLFSKEKVLTFGSDLVCGILENVVLHAILSEPMVILDGSTQCKRCRFERYEEILNRSRAQSRNEGPSSEIPPQIEKPSSDRQAAGGSKVPRPLLDKCGTCYK